LRIEDNLLLASGSINPGAARLSHRAAGIINIPAVFGLLSGHFLHYNKKKRKKITSRKGKA
jgi:hypothetical protein